MELVVDALFEHSRTCKLRRSTYFGKGTMGLLCETKSHVEPSIDGNKECGSFCCSE
jgi:hypothetical protein